MHGGVKVYRGAPAAARNFLDADRSRADDYYLAEGTGVARRFTTGPDRPVVERASLTGDGYEAWVAGLDPDTGQPCGRLRTDARAVRFVEVTINGPKSWSLAAELHPDIARAYETAQDRAAAHSQHTQPDDDLATPETIERIRHRISAAEHLREEAQQNLTALRDEPALANQPDADGWLASQHTVWRQERDQRHHTEHPTRAAQQHTRDAHLAPARLHQHRQPAPNIDHGPSLGR